MKRTTIGYSQAFFEAECTSGFCGQVDFSCHCEDTHARMSAVSYALSEYGLRWDVRSEFRGAGDFYLRRNIHRHTDFLSPQTGSLRFCAKVKSPSLAAFLALCRGSCPDAYRYFRCVEDIDSLHLCAVCGVAFLGCTVFSSLSLSRCPTGGCCAYSLFDR